MIDAKLNLMNTANTMHKLLCSIRLSAKTEQWSGLSA